MRPVAGHGPHGALRENLDSRGLADPASTLIFYMAGGTAPEIARRLTARGLPANTPAVLVESLSPPGEKRWSGTLDQLAATVAKKFDAPVLIGIDGAWTRSARRSIQATLYS